VAQGEAADLTWKSEVLRLIRSTWKTDQIFSLADVYQLSSSIAARHPENRHVDEKLRQVLQQLREDGEITFVDNDGHYSPTKFSPEAGDPLTTISDESARRLLLRCREWFGQVIPSSELQHRVKGFGGQKGIYKPSGSKYALWIRQTAKGAYPDKKLEYRPDGSWTYRYSPEGRAGRTEMSLDTNQSLLACARDHVPIGVFRQASNVDGMTAYEVLGVAYVQSFDGEHFVLQGEPIDEASLPLPENLVPTFHVFEREPAHVSNVLRTIRDGRFGIRIRQLYHDRCSLCNIGFRIGSLAVGMDAAHIVPVEKGGVIGNLRNGILLCKNHHALFDGNAWTMDEDLAIRVAPDKALRESALGNHILDVEGKRLENLPSNPINYPAVEAIRWRMQEFDKAWA
jgi:hypothetical protein